MAASLRYYWRNARVRLRACSRAPLRAVRGAAAARLLFALLFVGFGSSGLYSSAWGQSRCEIRSAYVEPAEGVYQLNATIDFDLPEGARAAIRQGVPLTLHLDIVVKRRRSYWLDETIATLDQNYEMVFHALSERYLVRNLNSGEQASYATLDAALDELRVINNLPILDEALIRRSGRHEISVRAGLDVHTMPDTLRFILFWSDDWRQRSEWYTWSPQL